MATETQKTEAPTGGGTTPRMTHLCDPPFTHGLCGAPIRRVIPGATEVACVVCADLAAQGL